jgi:hypothetical protein
MLQNGDSAAYGAPEPDHARRNTLLRLGALSAMCGLGALGLHDEVLAAAAAKRKPDTPPQLLTREELALTAVLADLIIPRTDTPGAFDVGAHRTIDHMLKVCALAPVQNEFRAGLARIDSVAMANGGKRFTALPPARQTALLQALDTGSAPFGATDGRFFGLLKGYVAFAYYTSEAGATRELAYLPVPGGFKGDVMLTPSTRTWAI